MRLFNLKLTVMKHIIPILSLFLLLSCESREEQIRKSREAGEMAIKEANEAWERHKMQEQHRADSLLRIIRQ